jgi:hypothetical protein
MRNLGEPLMRTAVLVAATLSLSGCGGNEALDPSLIPDVEGVWSFSAIVQFSEISATCSAIGNMSLAQERQTFLGTYTRSETCSGGGSASTGSDAGNISKGQLSVETIQFSISSCDYRGIFVTQDPIDRLSGTILCTSINLDGSVSTSAGTWQADRLSKAA